MATCLHLGMPKTATTSFQKHLFSGHSGIEYLGAFRGSGNARQRFPEAAVRDLNAHLLQPQDAPPKDRCRRQLAALLLRTSAAGCVPLWSREGTTAGSPDLKRRQAGVFRDMLGECKVMIFVRHPLTFTESMYFESLKRFHNLNRDRPPWGRRFGKRPCWFSVEAWLEETWDLPHKDAMSHLLCAETADAYAEKFGRENVKLLLFERFVEDPPAVIREMCQFLGVDAEEAVGLMDGKRERARWTEEQVRRLRKIGKTPWQSFLFRHGTRRTRQRMLGLDGRDAAGRGPKARLEIPAVWRKRIVAFVREDHRGLAQRWGLPLEQYEYPL